MGKSLTVIIVTFNSQDVITKCLEGVYSREYDIIVVDNASSDNTVGIIRNKFPSVEVITSSKNLGYGRAANLGLKKVGSGYALLLNPDVITTDSAVKELVNKANGYQAAAIFAPRTRKDKATEHYNDEKTDWVSGAVMLFDINKLKNIGFFDENIFLFYEETDLCKRARKAGYEIILFNGIYMEHLVGRSSNPNPELTYMKYWQMAWSRFYFNHKHYSRLEYIITSSGYLLKFAFKFLIYIFSHGDERKIKYQASLAGGIAYIMGKDAFDGMENPRGLKR